MSSVLFNIAIDWVLHHIVEGQGRGIRWTSFSTLEDLDFAGDLALLSHTWQHIQEGIPYTDKFTYLRSVLCQDGGTGMDIQNRLNKARNAFMSLRSVWRTASYSTKTMLRIYQSCVLSTLFYSSECWRMKEHDLSRLGSSNPASLRKILRIFWPRKISNDEL